MSDSFKNNDKIVVDLYDQKISRLPIEDPEELENVLINAAYKLADGNDAVILEALLNTLVDYYVFDLEPGDDIEDVGFLVSDIEDRVCNAVAFRRHMDESDYPARDPEDSGEHESEDDGLDEDEEDDETAYDGAEERIPVCIEYAKTYIPPSDPAKAPARLSRDSDDVSDRDIPAMMRRFESDGIEITVTLVPKREFDGE